jgi:hypothetical protein
MIHLALLSHSPQTRKHTSPNIYLPCYLAPGDNIRQSIQDKWGVIGNMLGNIVGTHWEPKKILYCPPPPLYSTPRRETNWVYWVHALQFLIYEHNFYSQTVFITSLAKANGRGIVGDIVKSQNYSHCNNGRTIIENAHVATCEPRMWIW